MPLYFRYADFVSLLWRMSDFNPWRRICSIRCFGAVVWPMRAAVSVMMIGVSRMPFMVIGGFEKVMIFPLSFLKRQFCMECARLKVRVKHDKSENSAWSIWAAVMSVAANIAPVKFASRRSE